MLAMTHLLFVVQTATVLAATDGECARRLVAIDQEIADATRKSLADVIDNAYVKAGTPC